MALETKGAYGYRAKATIVKKAKKKAEKEGKTLSQKIEELLISYIDEDKHSK